MYNLIIADDEYIIRESLANLVDWQAIGFHVVLTARDGCEVIEMLKQRQDIHVILSDIQMPVVSGLEVARYVFEKKLPVRVVMISGYREFEYARQAISYNVSDYLLKPINLADITRAFSQIKDKIDEFEAERQQLESQKKKLTQYKSAAVEKFFELAYLGLFTDKKGVSFYLNQFELSEELSHLRVYEIALQIQNIENCNVLTGEIIYNIASMLQKQYRIPNSPVILELSETAYTMIQLVPPTMDGNQVQLFFIEIEKALHDVCGAELNSQIDVKDWGLFDYVLEMHIRMEKSRTSAEDYLVSMAHQYLMILNMTPEIEQTAANLTAIFRQLTDTESQPGLIQKMSRLFAIMRELMLQQFPGVYEIDLHRFSQQPGQDTYDSFHRQMHLFYRVLQSRKNSSLSAVDIVKGMIQEHLSENITLQQAAAKTFLSPNYLSRLFKVETGENFSDYTIRMKMEKAAELLSVPNYKVYEVSELLGYKKIQYFYKLFKRIYFCTPSEYRDTLRKSAAEGIDQTSRKSNQ